MSENSERESLAAAPRWSPEMVAERLAAMTDDDREALLRFGHRKAPWESTPDIARRILLSDPRVTLGGIESIDRIFRAAYDALVEL